MENEDDVNDESKTTETSQQPAASETQNTLEQGNKALTEQVAQLTLLVQQLQAQKTAEPQKQVQEEDLYDDEDHTQVLSDPKKLKTIMKNIQKKAREEATLEIAKTIPKIVEAQLFQALEIRDFWKENPELLERRSEVALESQRIQNENPSWNLSKVLEEVKKKCKTSRNNFAPGGGSGGKKKASPKDALQADLDAMV